MFPRPTRRLLLSLAFGAMAIKAAVPMGFMVAVAGGHLQLTLCRAYGEVHMPLGVESAGAHHHHAATVAAAHAGHSEHGASQCPFAAAHGAGLLAGQSLIPAPYYSTVSIRQDATPISIPIAPPWRFRAPRGPPIHA